MNPPPTVVEVQEVSRWYGDVVALHRLSVAIGPGVTGLLGPNGAGKTSLIRILVGLMPADEGGVWILGRDPRRDVGVRGRIGYVPEAQALPGRVSAHRFVRALAVQHRMEDPDAAAASSLQVAGLDPGDSRAVHTYSKGMRQRVKIAAALVHGPAVLVLDEPLNGLDPQGRVQVMTLLERLGRMGVAVIVSSHVLHEVQRFAPRVLVLVQGRLAAEGSPRAIRALMDDRPARTRIRSDSARVLGAALLTAGAVTRVEVADDRTLVVDAAQPALLRDLLPVVARDAGAVLTEVTPLDEDLDSVFTYLVQRGLR